MVQDSIVQENKETRERKRESERDNAGHRGEGKEMKEQIQNTNAERKRK